MPKLEWKGGALLAPLPVVLVSSALPDEKPNVATVAWCGITCTQPPKVYISLRPSRHSHEIISKTGEFVMNPVPASLVRAADTCGVLTGRKADKFEKCHLTPEPSFKVACPSIAECPLSLECRVTDVISLGTHDMFLADVEAVAVSPDLVDDKNALHLERAGLSAFAHGEYFELGRRIGTFGFSVRKKPGKRPHGRSSGTR